MYVDGNPLHLPETGTTVRLKAGRRHIQDGPYANTKKQLAGFAILELPSLDAALEWAARCPAARRSLRSRHRGVFGRLMERPSFARAVEEAEPYRKFFPR